MSEQSSGDAERVGDLLEQAYNLLIEARGQLDQGSKEWDYVQSAAARTESAQVVIEGPEVLEDGREEPERSEPADFGYGESTGVQDL
jgi:hypothetical protein